jgi:hypothetical protein
MPIKKAYKSKEEEEVLGVGGVQRAPGYPEPSAITNNK